MLSIFIILLLLWHKLSTAIIIRADNREACLQPETRPGRFLKIIFQKGKIIDKLSLIASAGAPHLGSSPANILPFSIYGYRKHILMQQTSFSLSMLQPSKMSDKTSSVLKTLIYCVLYGLQLNKEEAAVGGWLYRPSTPALVTLLKRVQQQQGRDVGYKVVN